jgi:hypothetical protein
VSSHELLAHNALPVSLSPPGRGKRVVRFRVDWIDAACTRFSKITIDKI